MKTLLSILGLAALHFVAAIGVFIYVWHPGDDSNEIPSMPNRACVTAFDVLWFPFMQIAKATHVRGASLAELLVFVASSLLWGILLYAGIVGAWRLWHLKVQHETA